MKRWILYGAALALLGISPFRGMDIGKLSPVETVWLAHQNGQVLIQTDAGDIGRGATVQEALANLQDSAAGIVFLETADYLIVQTGAQMLLSQEGDVFRPSCMVCLAERMPDLEQATEFLRTHEPGTTFRQWKAERSSLPLLQEKDGRFAWHDG